MQTITNPILTGFNPDPSILRVGEDYYIATSTFEWFPGVQIHHSKDLVHWRLLTRPLNRISQLNMEGELNSGGVWAPCLTYDDGLFYLIYTDVKSRKGAFKDTHNYMVTAPDMMGPWSEPIFLNSSGFDPSLFHDDDGRKWLVNMLWDHRKGNNKFAGTALQEYSVEERRLIGPVINIFKGTELKLTEGPHLYKRNGFYYLMTAEGGTQYNHAVTMARAKSIEGPYEVDPTNPILTSAGKPELALQKAGHGSLVETHTGEWYLAHLCARPVKDKYCNLGRETALQRCYWTEDHWLRVEEGNWPKSSVKAPRIEPFVFEAEPVVDHFDDASLGVVWNTLRIAPGPDWLSLTERPGFLRLKGMESMSSLHRQSLVARRQQAFHCEVETVVEFEPDNFQQLAGLIVYYDTEDYMYLRITHHEVHGKCIGIIQSVGGVYDELLDTDIPLQDITRCKLKAIIDREALQFYYAAEGGEWAAIGPVVDICHLSDDYPDYIRFTGTFIGMCVQDLSGTRKHADFDSFSYIEKAVE
ncbi:glycoside hydrolase family 43 protein [Paenibacillus sp. FSL H7-0331]|uniref:glycoside hydrolase family 43 protein n=1 Tax=Paenibacillus sp. FSL H7-0331 TaxID=1920421 RepID=UPI00096E4D6D|nr:glycoside hydrolase family 43 protein [Paenibacillus sp. FSL H7-0331]OMF08975.1 glycoside hydrolase 43 family protein [Paenibacillus sp. FSL H7-0331]